MTQLGDELDRSRERTLQHRVWMLEADIGRLRIALAATRTILVQLRDLSKPSLHKGFNMWIASIDAALDGE